MNEDLEDIRAELEDEGYLKKKSTKNKKKKKKVIRFDRFQATDGTEIYVGRNNKQNEYLTNRQAGKEDIWLHTKDIPGSHVIIKSTSPSEETIVEAATIAGFLQQIETLFLCSGRLHESEARPKTKWRKTRIRHL